MSRGGDRWEDVGTEGEMWVQKGRREDRGGDLRTEGEI